MPPSVWSAWCRCAPGEGQGRAGPAVPGASLAGREAAPASPREPPACACRRGPAPPPLDGPSARRGSLLHCGCPGAGRLSPVRAVALGDGRTADSLRGPWEAVTVEGGHYGVAVSWAPVACSSLRSPGRSLMEKGCVLCWPRGPGRSSPRHWHAVGPLCPPLCSCDLGGCRQGHGEATEELHCFSHCEPRVLWSAVRFPLVPGERVCPSVHVQVGPLEVWGDCLLFSLPVAGGNSRGFL